MELKRSQLTLFLRNQVRFENNVASAVKEFAVDLLVIMTAFDAKHQGECTAENYRKMEVFITLIASETEVE